MEDLTVCSYEAGYESQYNNETAIKWPATVLAYVTLSSNYGHEWQLFCPDSMSTRTASGITDTSWYCYAHVLVYSTLPKTECYN